MTEPFPIVIDVDENLLGPVLRKLDAMPGIVTIHLRMNKNGSPALQSKPTALVRAIQRQIGTSHKMVPAKQGDAKTGLRQAIAHGLGRGAMHYKILQEFLVRNGFSRNSVSAVLSRMIEEKHVKRAGAGIYRLTGRGAQKYGKYEQLGDGAQAPRPVKRTLPNNTKGLRFFILTVLRAHKINHSDLKRRMIGEGYVDNNMYTMLPKMIEEGLIRRLGTGATSEYEITEHGLNAMSRKPEAPTIEASANHGEMTNG